MAHTEDAPSRLRKVAALAVSLLGIMFGFVSPSDVTAAD
jgi:hypothetical protein